MWIGPDTYNVANLCGQKVFEQLTSLKDLQHPVSHQKLTVHRRTVADGKTRRTSTGSSSACSSYPITEAPEHSDQLGDMTIIFEGPSWKINDTDKCADTFTTWLQNRKDNQHNRRQFAKEHFGNTGRSNITGTELEYFYPPAMHRALRSAETIGRRIAVIAHKKYNTKETWYKEMSKVAKKSSDQKLAFSEDGVVAFVEHFKEFLVSSSFEGLTGTVLQTFGQGLQELYQWLLRTPVGLTGMEFDVNARALLGFQYILIFGTNHVTATIKRRVFLSTLCVKPENAVDIVLAALAMHNFLRSNVPGRYTTPGEVP